MNGLKSKRWVATITSMSVLLLSSWVEAQAKPRTSASFLVRVIEAAQVKNPKKDPKMDPIRRHLKPFKGRYNQFILLSSKNMTIQTGNSGKIKLPGNKHFTLTLLGFTTGRVQRVRYEVQLPRTRMKRSVAPGGQTLDAIRNGPKMTIVSTIVR